MGEMLPNQPALPDTPGALHRKKKKKSLALVLSQLHHKLAA